MDVVSVSVGLLCAVLLVYTLYRTRRTNLPPQPPKWPIVGNLPMISADKPKQLAELSTQLGPTIALKLGGLLQIIVHDYETAKKVFNDDNTTGRDQNFIMNRLLTAKGFLAVEGELWRQHRRFAISTLRELGVGKEWLEDMILEEVTDLIQDLAAQQGRPFNPRSQLTLSISNVVCALTFGKRFDHNDQQFLRMSGLIGQMFSVSDQAAPVSAFPILQYVPGRVRRACRRFIAVSSDVAQWCAGRIAEHDAHPSYKSDFIDHYRMETVKRANDVHSTFSEKELQATVETLFRAGTDTTSVTLMWALVYMVENPEVLHKVQLEIDRVIGPNRLIRLADKASLPYTEAVLLEVQRCASLVPLGIPQSNFRAMKIDGYDIPARCVLSLNSYAIHRNPNYWKHPNAFYPEHFLSPDGLISVPQYFVPFGIGKRACLGEPLAKMDLFLFFANIAQRFDLRRDADSPLSSDNYVSGFLRVPAPFKLCFTERA